MAHSVSTGTRKLGIIWAALFFLRLQFFTNDFLQLLTTTKSIAVLLRTVVFWTCFEILVGNAGSFKSRCILADAMVLRIKKPAIAEICNCGFSTYIAWRLSVSFSHGFFDQLRQLLITEAGHWLAIHKKFRCGADV